MKDQVIRLNSIGISSFTWIVQQFSRLEEILEKAVNSGGSGKGEGLEKMLDSLFEKISEDLEVLLVALDKALPLADEASFLGEFTLSCVPSMEPTLLSFFLLTRCFLRNRG